MKKSAIIISVIAILLSSFQAMAIKASKQTFNYVQPDGTTIKIQLHGDEFHHWTTDENGKVLTLGADRYYRVSGSQIPMESQFSKLNRAKANQTMRSASEAADITHGEHKFLVILVQWEDMMFTLDSPQEQFYNLLNEPGYSKNGGTGSAYDYYYENSNHQFNPQFDVYGPYTVSGKYADYGGNDQWGNDVNPDGAFYKACQLADDDIDFSQYDQDHDGYVDQVFFYYAGHNEAEYGGADTIWPHKYAFYYYSGYFDGVRVYDYACTSEYRGSYGSTMCGIGTFCHEFGHVIGLPDFYDTDYEQNGSANSLDSFSLMDSGSYNNSGCTPPYLSAIERNLLGWMDKPEVIDQKGNYELEAIHERKAYVINSENPGEYFLMETRDATGWDKPLPGGMLIYHVDQSNNNVHGQTAKQRWNNWNGINCYSDHPCYYIEKAKNSYYESYYVYPGSGNVTTFRGKSWAKVDTDFSLNNIKYNGGVTTFVASSSIVKFIVGTVKDLWGTPVSDATIEVSTTAGSRIMTTKSATDGTYTLDLSEQEETEFVLKVSHEEFISQTVNVNVPRNTVTADIVMYSEWDGEPETLTKAGNYSGNCYGFGKNVSIMGAIKLSAEDLKGKAGCTLNTVSFIIADSNASSVSAFVYVDGEKQIDQEVLNVNYQGWTTVDMNKWNFKIPEGKDIMVGYSVTKPADGKPLAMDDGPWVEGGGYSSLQRTSPNWKALSANLMVQVGISATNNTLRSEGFSFIRKTADGDYEVVPGRGLTIKTVKYTNTGDCITADVTYTNGASETIEWEL